jgi:hypothetical protein
MAITQQIDPSKQLTIFKVEGKTHPDEIIQTIDQYFKGQTTKNSLWDFSNIELEEHVSHAGTEKIARFSEQYQNIQENSKVALVATTPLGLGLLRLYEGLTKADGADYAVKSFRSIELAMEWLVESL